MTHTLQLVLIHNSNQSNGVDTALVQWITAVVQDRSEFALSVVEPFDLRFIDDFSEQPGRRVCLRALAAADAYIVLVPARHLGYQHGLKVLMARWPEHLQGRPCSFVGYGTTTGGEDEVDELGCELLKLQAMPVGGYVKFAEIAERLEQGLGLEHVAQARVSMAQLLIQLAWWARALKDARAFSPLQKFA
ncbi:NAD(P)H-dependent oxidoreductase [Pseudomonas siliginis]|uniref:NAD(P)H-dependent oxidoreductase n=1 Tax=Pseudomonas siliginis TaxID=2842346 RepID=UPI00386B687E